MTHDLVTIDPPPHAPSENIQSITEAAREALENMGRDAESYIASAQRLGAAIKWAKEHLEHGKFGEWCQSVVGLKASQTSIYRRLSEAGADLELAREWARKTGHSNANTRDLRLLLRLVDAWWAATGQEQPSKRRAKTGVKVSAVKSSEVGEQPSSVGLTNAFPPNIGTAADMTVEAILEHRAATGEDVLDATLGYIAAAVRSRSSQTCLIPQLSAPTGPKNPGEEYDDKAKEPDKVETEETDVTDETDAADETPLDRLMRLRGIHPSQSSSEGKGPLDPSNDAAGLS